MGGGRQLVTEHEVERELRRVFRRLTRSGSHIARVDDDWFGLFVARNRWQRPVLRIEARLWQVFEARDLVEREEVQGRIIWNASEAGLALLRRLEARDDPFRTQHQQRRLDTVAVGEEVAVAEFNDAESPLGWLHSRKGADGKPLISALQLEAGERLRRDFTLARMSPRLTTDWTMALGPGGVPRSGAGRVEMTDNALAARQRLARAVAGVGPVLSDVLLAVCCHLQGLEEAEKSFGWPRRAGKIVLLIALDRLITHYGMNNAPRKGRGQSVPPQA